MSSKISWWLLNAVAVSAVMLSSPGQRMRTCQDSDCHAEASNRSELVQGDIVCHCCWRDCDSQTEDAQPQGSFTQKATELSWAADDVDAWVVLCHRLQEMLDWNKYTPILETVKVGVESKGATAQVIGVADLDGMVEGVRAAVGQGRRPLVFAVALQFAVDPNGTASKLNVAKEAGAYMVAYQTEPLFNDLGFRRDMFYTAIDMAAKMGAHEMWDYSLAHTTNYPHIDSELIFRYVPPGYVPKLDAGVDLHSTLANVEGIGYIGNNRKQLHAKYVGMFEGHLRTENSIYNNDKLRTFLEAYPLQLNQHRYQSCCPRNFAYESKFQHLEAFRMSILLGNKACVMSAPSSDKDMEVWKDVVHFVEVEETVSMTKRLRENLTECRMQSYETYKREFAPRKLLERSGFFQAWSPPRGK